MQGQNTQKLLTMTEVSFPSFLDGLSLRAHHLSSYPRTGVRRTSKRRNTKRVWIKRSFVA